MTGGSRTKTGCLTCRLRKKKCDEQRPACQACCRSQLACYGYDAPVPDWIKHKRTWAEVTNSVEAKNIRHLAESHYKASRKVESESEEVQAAEAALDVGQISGHHGRHSATRLSPWDPAPALLARLGILRASNIWQIQPDTIWWDSKLGSLGATDGSSAQQETRLLMIFLQVIHPITHTFYKLSSNSDRNWLLNRIVKDRALYYAALSVSACFEFSLSQPTTTDEIGICPKVRSLQSSSVRKLRLEVEAYSASASTDTQYLVLEGVRLVDVILNLLNLETFSMLGGCWEMHHSAARAIFDHIETSLQPQDNEMNRGVIASVLRALPLNDERRRTLTFCITNFIWIDVVATATFGLSTYAVCSFDYIPLLESGEIRTQDVMGCSILVLVADIAREEQWYQALQADAVDLDAPTEIASKYVSLANRLHSELARLDVSDHALELDTIDEDARHVKLISTIWAYAALIYLEVVFSQAVFSDATLLQTFVELCLQKLETLPTHLVIRVCWPYTIAGSMSTDGVQHARFREILAKTMREQQAPGITWKGLIVMQECWRLRVAQGDTVIGWREAMSSLKTKVLLV